MNHERELNQDDSTRRSISRSTKNSVILLDTPASFCHEKGCFSQACRTTSSFLSADSKKSVGHKSFRWSGNSLTDERMVDGFFHPENITAYGLAAELIRFPREHGP